MKSTHWLSALLVSISIIIAAIVINYGVVHRNASENVIVVTGMAERNFESDLIVWKSQFMVKNMNLTTAYAELKKQSEATKKFLQSKGIDDAEMTFSAVEINKDFIYSTTYGNSTSTFDGYVLTQRVNVVSNDVAKVEKISREITELINSGIEISSLSPEYYYTKLANLKIAMLADAAQDGYVRAKTIAENGKGKLGKMMKSAMGVFQIVAQNSSEDYSWGGTFNTSSKKKTASVTVKMQYQVK